MKPWLKRPPLLEVYFILYETSEYVYVPVTGFSSAGRLSSGRQHGKLICCQLPWSQTDGFCSQPDADQTEPQRSRWPARSRREREQKLARVLQQAMSKTIPRLYSFPCKMVLIMAL